MTKQEVIEMYQKGASISEIDRQTSDFSYRKIKEIITDAGLQIRGGRKKREFTNQQIQQLKDLYYNKEIPFKEIAKTLKTGVETLKNYMKEHDMKLRDFRVSSVNKGINKNYFSNIDNSHKAYFLGLLFTDGSVRKTGENRQGQIRIQLQAQDKEILEKLKKELNVTSELIYDPRGKGCYSLEFANEQIFQDLGKYNIVPNKTYNIHNLPTNIPDLFKIDFIRGLFDGDGCLTFDKETKSKDVTLNFTSYYESVITDFQLLIDQLIHKEKHNKNVYTQCWHTQWRGYNQVMQILNILYKDADIYLQRKYNKYQQLLTRN